MANEVLRYNRGFVRSLRKNQRVRLTATVNPAIDGVFNLTSRFGEYGRLRGNGKDLFFAYSHFPTPPFEYETQVTFAGSATEGRFLWTSRRTLVLLYRGADGVYEQFSDDDGLTWRDLQFFAAGTHCDLSAARDGTLQFARYDSVGGFIRMHLQPPGEPNPLPSTTIADSTLLPLLFVDDSFRIVPDLRGWWWLHARIQGETATSLWYTTDEQGTNPGVSTWSRTSGAVGGISSGTHPGMGIGDDGTLWAWAYVAGKLQMTRRAPGETSFSTPATVKDTAGADLLVKDAASSFALAYEGPRRLVLATQITGESLVSDWGSGDDAATGQRFT